jgi:anhydro-N-acetylmuramic acid kinase
MVQSRRILKKLTVIGLNSGTSMDGIDAAIFRLSPAKLGNGDGRDTPGIETELVYSGLVPFDPHFVAKMQKVVAGGALDWRTVCLLNTALGEAFADAALTIIKQAGMTPSEIDLIGSHGQTLWHVPDATDFWGTDTRGTLQLGESSVIWARTNIPVIADFRTADMAVGGQGAPLVSFADEVLFGGRGTACGVLNLGGIANITAINARGRAVMAFDTGPANMIIDRACLAFFDKEYDADGMIARKGKIDEKWLNEILDEAYFKRKPPKTTGRELFGRPYADELIRQAKARGLSGEDTLATLTAFTAKSVANAYADFIESTVHLDEIVVGGGGADNSYLIELLKKYWSHEVKILRHEDFGISTKFKEALLFALLAYTTYFGVPNNVPVCTGASKRVCLGKLVGAR